MIQLEGSIFWRVVDAERMIATTSDAASDVWLHVRNGLTQALGKTTLEQFMNDVSGVVQGVVDHEVNDTFYSDRGLHVSYVEVTRFEFPEAATRQVLQKII